MVIKPRHGYPERYYSDLAIVWRWSVGAVLVVGSVAFGLTYLAVQDRAKDMAAASALAIFVLVLLGAAASVWSCTYGVTIHPYFDRQVGEIDTFCRGHALAAELATLDEVAAELGVAPPSGYGFNDDMRGEPLTWHDAAKGLLTFEALMDAIHARPELVGRPEALAADLKGIAHALRRAADREIRFCLLLRAGDSTNAIEWEQRKGTAF